MEIDFYHTRIIQYAHKKDDYGIIDRPDFSVTRKNSSCGDELTLTGTIVDGKVAQLKFVGTGCMISLAAAAMLVEALKGQSLEKAQNFSRDDMIKLFGVELGPQRTKCVLLSFETLHEAIKNFSHD